MSLSKKVGVIAGAATAAFAGASFGEYSPTDTESRIASLEQQITELKAQAANNSWLANSEEVRAMVNEVVADSATRTSLLQDGAMAGYMGPGKGFMLASGDGGFSMNIYGYNQFRWIWNNRDSGGAADFDENNVGFEASRTVFGFRGNLFDKDLAYNVSFLADYSGGVTLYDAYFDWALDEGWSIRWGQYKDFFQREDLVGDTTQLAVDRSFVSQICSLGRTQGVALNYASENFKFSVGYNDGYVPAYTSFAGQNANTGFTADGTEFGATARVDWLAAGTWDQFNDFTSWSTDEDFGFLLGGGVAWQNGEYGTLSSEVENFQYTIDASAEWGGPSLFASFTGRSNDTQGGSDFDQMGFVAQGSFNIDDKVEPFVRYEWFDWDGAVTDDTNIITVGFNYFFNNHDWKWTTDVVFGLDPITGTYAGVLPDTGTEDGQWALRTQMQVAF